MKSSELIRQILKLKYMGFSNTKRVFIAKQILYKLDKEDLMDILLTLQPPLGTIVNTYAFK